MYDPNTKEQVITLKDGRVIYKTHNGFKYWLIQKDETIIEVSKQYYNKVKKNRT